MFNEWKKRKKKSLLLLTFELRFGKKAQQHATTEMKLAASFPFPRVIFIRPPEIVQ
jgi:hypothetical protein